MHNAEAMPAAAQAREPGTNLRDPLVAEMIGEGKSWSLADEVVQGRPQQVFRGAPRNLAELYRQAMSHADRVMIVQDDLQLSYAAAFARAGSLAHALAEQFGVQRGTKVAVATANRAEWIIAVLAITSLGGIAALVNSRGVAEEMLRAIHAVDCELVILDARCADLIAVTEPSPTWPRIVVGTPESGLRQSDAEFAALAVDSGTFEPIDCASDSGAIILFTSGTTGFPKGALLSHGAVAHSVSLAVFMGALQDLRFERETGTSLPESSRSMATPAVILGPMFHLSGIMPIFRAISVGTTIHIMSKWNVDVAIEMIERVGMSRLSFVPAMLWDLLRSPRATDEVLGKVAYMANGAAALNPTLLSEIRRRMPNCLLSNTYGQTETTAWTCSISGAAYLDNPDACGWAAPTISVSVRRDDGSECAVGEPGELWVSSPGLMSEYVGDPKATAETLQDGWLASGDVGYQDEAGIFRIVDRKKNMVISGGENIYCAEVERVITDFPGVKDCIAYGLPDDRLGERLAVTAVVRDGAAPSAQEIKDFCKTHLAIYKVPREVVVTFEPLPRTASGKVDRGTFLRNLRSD